VGFRYTCRSLACGFDVDGYVRNLPDGRVELVAEGESGELGAFLAAVRREFSSAIQDVTTESQSPGAPPLAGFSIRY
jgi:acylphosphatase